MNYEEIKTKYEIAKKKFEDFKMSVDKDWDFDRPFIEYQQTIWESSLAKEYEKLTALELANRPTYKLRDPQNWEKKLGIPVDDFVACCKQHCFTDYDGHGYYGTESQISDIEVYPSDILKMKRTDFTHIWWYNK